MNSKYISHFLSYITSKNDTIPWSVNFVFLRQELQTCCRRPGTRLSRHMTGKRTYDSTNMAYPNQLSEKEKRLDLQPHIPPNPAVDLVLTVASSRGLTSEIQARGRSVRWCEKCGNGPQPTRTGRARDTGNPETLRQCTWVLGSEARNSVFTHPKLPRRGTKLRLTGDTGVTYDRSTFLTGR